MGLYLGIAGASFAVALSLAGRTYPMAHRGLVMGVAASANSRVVLAAFFAPRLRQIVGWRGVFGWMVVPVVVTMALHGALVRRDIGCADGHGAGGWDHVAGVLRRPACPWLCLLYGVTFGGFAGLSSILPIVLHDQFAMDAVTAGSVTALCGLVGA